MKALLPVYCRPLGYVVLLVALFVDTSSFLTFLVFNVLCLEFGLKKALVDRFFKR